MKQIAYSYYREPEPTTLWPELFVILVIVELFNVGFIVLGLIFIGWVFQLFLSFFGNKKTYIRRRVI